MTWNRSDAAHRRPWSKDDIRRARQIRLKPVLEQLGYRFLPRPNGNHAIAGLAGDIVIKDHYWRCLDSGQAGNAIDFFVKVRGVSFNEAMTLLTQSAGS